MKISNITTLLILFSFHITLKATLVGSNITVSRNNYTTFPQNDFFSPNEIRGFALMNSGFGLQNSSTSCLFTGLFPIRVAMDLNGGTLNLQEDLMVENIQTLDNLGNILAATIKSFILPSNLQTLGSSADSTFYTFQNIEMHLKSDVILQGRISFDGSCKIIGFGKTLTIDVGQIEVASGAELILQDLVLNGVQGNNIRCEDDTGVIRFDSVNCIQYDDYNFSNGALRFKNKNKIGGSDTMFIYETSVTSTILTDASLWVDVNCTFSYDPIGGGNNLFVFTDDTSKLVLNSASLHTTLTGLQLTKGTLEIKGKSFISSEKTDAGIINNGITLGDGTNDMIVKLTLGSSLTVLENSTLINNNVSTSSWTMENDATKLIFNTGAEFRLNQNTRIRPGLVIFNDFSTLRLQGNSLDAAIVPVNRLRRIN